MLKTNKSVAKRISYTGTGKLKRTKANKSHLLIKKSKKRKRNLRQTGYVDKSDFSRVRRMLPYG